MSKGQKPQYKAFISRPGKDGGKAFFTEIGAAWEVAEGGISIKLNALPLDGSVVLFPNRDE